MSALEVVPEDMGRMLADGRKWRKAAAAKRPTSERVINGLSTWLEPRHFLFIDPSQQRAHGVAIQYRPRKALQVAEILGSDALPKRLDAARKRISLNSR
jgi:hypothetical protein